jgi:hypothetical protein
MSTLENESARPSFYEIERFPQLANLVKNWQATHDEFLLLDAPMRRFKSARHIQCFASVYDQVANLFMHCRYHTSSRQKWMLRIQAFEAWECVTCVPMLECLAD